MANSTQCAECKSTIDPDTAMEFEGRNLCQTCWENLIISDTTSTAAPPDVARGVRHDTAKQPEPYGSEADIRRWTAHEQGARTTWSESGQPRGCPECGSREPAARKVIGGMPLWAHLFTLGRLMAALTTKHVWVCRECGHIFKRPR